MMLASVQKASRGEGASRSPVRQSRGQGRATGRDLVSRLSRHADLARVVPSLLELPGRLGFRTAFCTAAAAWSIALVLMLGCFEVVRW